MSNPRSPPLEPKSGSPEEAAEDSGIHDKPDDMDRPSGRPTLRPSLPTEELAARMMETPDSVSAPYVGSPGKFRVPTLPQFSLMEDPTRPTLDPAPPRLRSEDSRETRRVPTPAPDELDGPAPREERETEPAPETPVARRIAEAPALRAQPPRPAARQSPPTRLSQNLAAQRTPGLDPLIQRMKERFGAADYLSAMEVAQEILRDHPGHAGAKGYAESCAKVLEQRYSLHLGGLCGVPVPIMDGEQVRWLDLDHRAGFLFSLVDGHTNLEELLDISGMKRIDALRTLCDLLDLEAIRIDPI